MMTTIKITTHALRDLMGDSFDFEQYERGRKDAYEYIKHHTAEEIEQQHTESMKWIQNPNPRRRPGPSYWMGCIDVLEWKL